MKTAPVAAICIIATSFVALAGRPIILSEVEACSEADIVVVGTVEAAKDLPDTDPFDEPKWSERFTQTAEITSFKVLMGDPPTKLTICGGKAPAGTDYRLEDGEFLLLLKKVGDGFYRAVDWSYSFMPAKGGKVEWLLDRESKKTKWITTAEALERIKKSRKANKASHHNPLPAPSLILPRNYNLQPESKPRSR
jgi:hypothetical protein